MSGRLQVFVLAVAMVTLGGPAVDAQDDGRELSDFLHDLGNRCRSLAGEQAAADLINIPTTLMTCVNVEQLQAEITPNLDMRKIVEVICGKKDHLLTCTRESLQTLKRCLRSEEKQFVDTVNQISEATDNFFCNNADDIFSSVSKDDGECAGYLVGKTIGCEIQLFITNYEGLQIEDLANKEKTCKEIEDTLRCVTDEDDKCKDSSFLRILNSYGNEVLDAISCPESGRGGATGLLALGTTPTSVVVPVAMCLAGPRVLHLQ